MEFLYTPENNAAFEDQVADADQAAWEAGAYKTPEEMKEIRGAFGVLELVGGGEPIPEFQEWQENRLRHKENLENWNTTRWLRGHKLKSRLGVHYDGTAWERFERAQNKSKRDRYWNNLQKGLDPDGFPMAMEPSRNPARPQLSDAMEAPGQVGFEQDRKEDYEQARSKPPGSSRKR